MSMKQQELIFTTSGRGTQDITSAISALISGQGVNMGLCHLFIKHTSASLMISENYDSQVRDDLENFLLRLIPDGDPLFKHTIEGKDDMPAHVRSVLTQTELTIPVNDGKLLLGTWQGIYLYEHRYKGNQRKIIVTIME